MLPHEFAPHKDGIMPRTLRNAKLVTFDIATRALTNHAPPRLRCEPGQPRVVARRQGAVVHGGDRVYQSAVHVRRGRELRTSARASVLVGGCRRASDGSRDRADRSTPDSPAEVYVQQGAAWAPRRITTTNRGSPTGAGHAATCITWKSKDGK
jgi:hypothetical protein